MSAMNHERYYYLPHFIICSHKDMSCQFFVCDEIFELFKCFYGSFCTLAGWVGMLLIVSCDLGLSTFFFDD
jgi:hypothetical protein